MTFHCLSACWFSHISKFFRQTCGGENESIALTFKFVCACVQEQAIKLGWIHNWKDWRRWIFVIFYSIKINLHSLLPTQIKNMFSFCKSISLMAHNHPSMMSLFRKILQALKAHYEMFKCSLKIYRHTLRPKNIISTRTWTHLQVFSLSISIFTDKTKPDGVFDYELIWARQWLQNKQKSACDLKQFYYCLWGKI